MRMYDSQSLKIIDYWTILENKYNNASMILYNKFQNSNITVTNNNEMKYLDVCIVYYDNNQKSFEQYTHIQSFLNDMMTTYGINIFHDYVIMYNEFNHNRKRYYDNNQHNEIKRTKYE